MILSAVLFDEDYLNQTEIWSEVPGATRSMKSGIPFQAEMLGCNFLKSKNMSKGISKLCNSGLAMVG